MWQREGLGTKCKDVAANLGVDTATVYRIVERFRKTGSVSKTSHLSRRVFRKLTVGAEMFIMHIVLVFIFMKLRESCMIILVLMLPCQLYACF